MVKLASGRLPGACRGRGRKAPALLTLALAFPMVEMVLGRIFEVSNIRARAGSTPRWGSPSPEGRA